MVINIANSPMTIRINIPSNKRGMIKEFCKQLNVRKIECKPAASTGSIIAYPKNEEEIQKVLKFCGENTLKPDLGESNSSKETNAAKMVIHKDKGASLEVNNMSIIELSNEGGGPEKLPKGLVSVWYDDGDNTVVNTSKLSKALRDLANHIDKNF